MNWSTLPLGGKKEGRKCRLKALRAHFCIGGVAAVGMTVAAGVLAYRNRFGGPFILDGKGSILENPYIRRLWPLWEAIATPPQATVTGRPVLSLSLALNYPISGENVWSYHAFNLVVHILADLVHFGIVRSTQISE